MAKIAITTPDQAPVESRSILDALKERIGFLSNLHRLMSISPAVLAGFVGLQESLSKTLDRKTRDAIALVVSEINGCSYCLATHSHAASTFSETTSEEIARNRQGDSENARTAAAALFAAKVIETRGNITDADLTAMRRNGFSDAQILEVVALSAQVSMANLLNNVAGTDIEFPLIEPARSE